jgi:glucokinase
MAEAGPVVGVDLGGTNMQFGVVDASGAMIGRARGKTGADGGLERVIANVVEGVGVACADAGIRTDEIDAVGVAAAGAIDMPRGIVLNAPNLGWANVPFRDMLQDAIGQRVVLDNDVNGCIWGEYRLGAGQGAGDLMGVWVGTGIGGGLVIGGRLHYGDGFTAGEIGHSIILPDAAREERTVEDVCSRTGLSRTLRRLMPAHPESMLHGIAPGQGVIGTDALHQGYAGGDRLTRSVVERSADLLGIAIANWVTVLSLKRVVVGGGITEALGREYLDRITGSFRANVFPPELQACELRMTELAADAGLLGAAILARESLVS